MQHHPSKKIQTPVRGAIPGRQFSATALAAAIGLLGVSQAGLAVCRPCRPGAVSLAAANPCNPCAAKKYNPCNPCAAKKHNPCNPCAAKKHNPCNPCAAKKHSPCSPCAAKKHSPCNPCAAKKHSPCNPCAANKPNPCAAKEVTRPSGYQPYQGDAAQLVVLGKMLWKDTKLSTNGLSCNSCHTGNAGFNKTFAKPYPHAVDMAANQFGIDQVHLDEMVQLCMVQPMQAEPFAWDSKKLAALTAYSAEIQKEFNPCAAKKSSPCNPCNPCNPGAAKKHGPCNPCGAHKKSPCHPCNPCRIQKPNPCNPCSAKRPGIWQNPVAVVK